MKSSLRPQASPPAVLTPSADIPELFYRLGAASGLLGEKFFGRPTAISLILDRLLATPRNTDEGPVSYDDLVETVLNVERDPTARDDHTRLVNARQALRYSLRRLKEFLGDDFFAQEGTAPNASYCRTESDDALGQRFTADVTASSIEHAAKRHLLEANGPALSAFFEKLCQRYKINDPIEQEMLRTTLLLAGLPFNFQHRDPAVMQARIDAFKAVREKLRTLSEDVIYFKNGKPRTRQPLNPLGTSNRFYFARTEWLQRDLPGFLPLETILAHHRQRFGETLPLGFFPCTKSVPAVPQIAPSRFAGLSRFDAAEALFRPPASKNNGKGEGPAQDSLTPESLRVELSRTVTPGGSVVVRRHRVREICLD